MFEGHCAGGRISSSVRARGAMCQLRPPLCTASFRVARASALMRWLSLRRRRSTRACCVRTPCRAGCGRSMRVRGTLRGREAILLRRALVVRRSSCGLHFAQQVFVWHARARQYAGYLLGEGAALGLAVCARRAALVVASPCPMEGHRAGERPLSFGARPWCDVLAAASTLRSRLSRGTRDTALAVSWEKVQHSSLLRARAVPGWLWSAHAL